MCCSAWKCRLLPRWHCNRHLDAPLPAAHAEECGSVYWRYGAALFYKAQDESDVFSDQLQGAATQHDDRVC